MGDYFQAIVDTQVSLDAAQDLAVFIRQWLIDQSIIEPKITDCVLSKSGMGYPPGANYLSVVEDDRFDIRHLWTNGLDIDVDHMVYPAGQAETAITCPTCKSTANEEWSGAVTEWYEQSGTAELKCTACGYVGSITQWYFDPQWGFGNLGFTFWNWAPLKKSFVIELGNRLGHSTVFVYGKL